MTPEPNINPNLPVKQLLFNETIETNEEGTTRRVWVEWESLKAWLQASDSKTAHFIVKTIDDSWSKRSELSRDVGLVERTFIEGDPT